MNHTFQNISCTF